ncbi:formylglycine-generating enzyme family protein [Brevirhabdus sp.]|uniref:formylglycine-generating enzyme family protein n=1 Tax=Brevirhabdus sp. TaxID=2004514 RepID=UPI004058FF54
MVEEVNPGAAGGCCSPQGAGAGKGVGGAAQRPLPTQAQRQAQILPQPTVDIPGGRALVGTATPVIADDGEGPLRSVPVKPFTMTQTTVTNAAFTKFILDTAYVTDAERFGWSFVFHSDVPKTIRETQGVVGTEWWRRVDGAHWRAPHGGDSAREWRLDHPVTQVSWNDARAFAAWCGGRLPSEAEWEHAARGGLGDVRFPWGDDEPDEASFLPCNIWQGRFPAANTGADGWKGTAPARSFAPNGFGLYNMVGNVWEWNADAYRVKSLKKAVRRKLQDMRGFRLLKGGSFLCHRSYCYRYRVAARIGNSPDTATPHQGFRVVWDK